jgi:hypothetical protein
MFGEPTARDREFDAVIAAVARRNKRQNVSHRAEPPKSYFNRSLHEKALAKRRKRKRGGPK